MKSQLLDIARERVLVFDGAMGTSIHAKELSLADYNGLENCTDVWYLLAPTSFRESIVASWP
jgi:5-methyltetrahydrofolate--homocysteine methyltransferase